MLFGTNDPWLAEFNEARRGPLGPVLERGAGIVEVVDTIPGIAHGLVDSAAQEAIRELSTDWLRRRVPGENS